jgi:hypothetical protein
VASCETTASVLGSKICSIKTLNCIRPHDLLY